jgi:hypothetical protein
MALVGAIVSWMRGKKPELPSAAEPMSTAITASDAEA